MKKFGSKLNDKTDNFISDDMDIDNLYYESELSKKLKFSNTFQHNNINPTTNSTEDSEKFNDYFIFKKKNFKKQNLPDEIIQTQIPPKIKDESHSIIDSSSSKKKEKNIKRLSDLENNNFYFILNVSENCTKEEIKKSYKNLCKVHHPDKGGDSEQFNKISRAYQILANDTCRKLYDNFASQAMNIIDHIISNTENGDNVDLDLLKSSYDLEALKIIIQMQN
jgi:hypothetical protein